MLATNGVEQVKAVKRLKLLATRILMAPRLWQLNGAGAIVGKNVRVYGQVRMKIAAGSRITLCDGVVLNSADSHNSLEARGPVILKTLRPSAELSIGADSGLTSATISASTTIAIGERVLLGAGTLITDSDHHLVDPPSGQSRRRLGMPTPRAQDRVSIGDDVFIGARSIVLKGVTIGNGTVIGAGSVVTGDIPSMVVAAGNPCRVIRALRNQ